MRTIIWDPPVFICGIVIHGPFEAYDFMASRTNQNVRWPAVKGLQFAKAQTAVLAAMDGRGSIEDARACFSLALKEAQLTP
ncbi:DUF982 domain-containing protein [Neorhizobium sp. T25_13]|uniref:DUF982 domain-containing protein n=1 Tax=Neorhizobium sp. T25_13 TaxID=2093830 RepID=UPI000CF9C66D|nr:DUF982 domain-containing protein [Neorhizobium sp. T25_13]